MRKLLARSEQVSWAASTTLPISTKFLEQFMGKFRNPAVTGIYVRQHTKTNTASANVFSGRDQWNIVTKLRIFDRSGDRVNMSGPALRLANQVEYGGSSRDVSDIAASQTNSDAILIMRVPFGNGRARSKRARDFAIPLAEILDGGGFEISTNSAAGANAVSGHVGTVQSGDYKIYCEITDLQDGEAPSRMIWKEFQWSKSEDTYATPGALRFFAMYAGIVGVQNGRSASAGPSKYSSQTIDINQADDDVLRDMALQDVPDQLGDSTASSFASKNDIFLGNAVPLVWPQGGQKITEMPFVKSFHVLTDLTQPASTDLPLAVACYIVPRSDANMEAGLGRAGHPAIVRDFGYVKSPDNNPQPLQNFAAHLQTLLPVRIASDPAKAGHRKALARNRK